jgi:hypothetical protein
MSFFNALGHYFEGFFKGLFGQIKTTVSTFLVSFVETDLGIAAVDAVNFVKIEVAPNTADKNALRDAAVAKLKSDLTKAGKDVSSFSQSFLNFLVESAYQAVQGGLKVAQDNLPAQAAQ